MLIMLIMLNRASSSSTTFPNTLDGKIAAKVSTFIEVMSCGIRMRKMLKIESIERKKCTNTI